MQNGRTTHPGWREFEELVTRIEKLLAPSGASVKSPDRIPDKTTGQLREVDGTIRYQVGSVPILITIECRDRTATQDVTWVEQLATKKEAVGAAATIAVSSAGFTAPARQVAERKGVFLRTLTEITDTEIIQWSEKIVIDVEFVEWSFAQPIAILLDTGDASTVIDPEINERITREGFLAVIAHEIGSERPVTLEALGGMFVEHGDYPRREGIEPFGEIFFDSGHGYVIETNKGPTKIRSVKLHLRIHRTCRPVPIKNVLEYCAPDSPVLQVAKWHFSHQGKNLTVFMAKGIGSHAGLTIERQ